MMVYIVSSVILSIVGIAVYLLFRQFNPGFRLRRIMLWAIIGLSLSLPALHAGLRVAPDNSNMQLSAHIASPAPVTLNEFCSCTDPGTHDVILYKASMAYDLMLENQPWLIFAYLIVSALFMLAFLHRLWTMFRLSRASRTMAEQIDLNGQSVGLVRNWEHSQAGSFRWFGKFIFWNDQLDALSEKEQNAILWHEYSHIQQGNTVEKTLLLLLRTVWFLNPVYYFIHQELDALSEFTADETAAQYAGGKKAYATLLLRVKTTQGLSLVHSLGGSQLKKRIKVLLGQRKPRKWAMLSVAMLGFSMLLIGDMFAETVIQNQMRDLQVYQFINKNHEETGKTEFCRKCTYETVENQLCY